MTQTAAAVFTAFGLSKKFITREVTEMGSHQLTANVQIGLSRHRCGLILVVGR